MAATTVACYRRPMPTILRALAALAFVVVAVHPHRAVAQATDSTKRVLILQLLEQMDAAGSMFAAMEAALPAQRATNPRIPPVFWDRLLVEARARRGELLESLVEPYARHLSTDDIRQLIAFYESPVGRKLVAVQPALLQESTKIGQLWGQKVGAEVGAKLADEGVSLLP